MSAPARENHGSALPPGTDIVSRSGYVRKVPQKRKWKTQFDQRPNSNAVHRDESCLVPCLGLACWLSRALPRRYEEIGSSAFLAFL